MTATRRGAGPSRIDAPASAQVSSDPASGGVSDGGWIPGVAELSTFCGGWL